MTGWKSKHSLKRTLRENLSDVPADLSNKEKPAIQRAEERAFQAEETARTKALRLEVRRRGSKNRGFLLLAAFRALKSISEILLQILWQ